MDEEETARIQENNEMRQRCKIAVFEAREESLSRIASLLSMGCSIANLKAIFCDDILRVASSNRLSERGQTQKYLDAGVNTDQIRKNLVGEEAPSDSGPMVDWGLQKALKEQARSSEATPSFELKPAVNEAGTRPVGLATQLPGYYFIESRARSGDKSHSQR